MMKKIYLLTLSGLMFAGVSAQSLTKGNANSTPAVVNTNVRVVGMSDERAVGDTLMYLPLPEFIVNPTDAAGFGYMNSDQDGLPENAGFGGGPWATGTDWKLFYDPTAGNPATVQFDTDYHADTSFYFGSTSWVEPVGQVSDWLTFGPITIPVTGATLHWRVRTPDQNFRDGYKVYVGGIGLNPTDFAPGDQVFYKADNTGIVGEDTVWTYRQVAVPASFAGSQAYFAFENEANDMFVLYMDEFRAIEANNLGVDANSSEGFALNQIMPNPATDVAYLNYAIGKTAEVTFVVTDINGKVVANLNQGTKAMGTYNFPLSVTEFNSGIYFVTLKAGNFSSTHKLVVAK